MDRTRAVVHSDLTRSSPHSPRKELVEFQSSESGKLQNRNDYQDTRRVLGMLRKQSELKHEMKEYRDEHHKETYSDIAWMNNSPGLGLGLW